MTEPGMTDGTLQNDGRTLPQTASHFSRSERKGHAQKNKFNYVISAGALAVALDVRSQARSPNGNAVCKSCAAGRGRSREAVAEEVPYTVPVAPC